MEVKESVQLSRLNSNMADKDKDTIRERLVDKMQQETVQLIQMDTVVEDRNLTHRTPVVKEAVKTKQGNEEEKKRQGKETRETA